jgi:hypothetical protein
MTIKEWADKLDGREYGEEVLKDERKQMADEGIIAVFGCSDDLVEYQGALDGEFGAWEGTETKLGKTSEGKISVITEGEREKIDELNEMENIEILLSPIIERMISIFAIWCPDGLETSWLIETEIEHETFDIMEDGELFCRGVVFHADSIPVVV